MADTEAGATDKAAEDWFGRVLDTVLGGLAAIVLFILMMLTVVDVVGRGMFNAPLPGGFEITELMMAVLVFAALPAVTQRENHIVIDLLDFMTPRWLVVPRQVLIYGLCAAVVGLWAWRTWAWGDRMARYGDVTEFLKIPLAPISYFISVLSAATGVIFVVLAWRYATGKARLRTGMNLS
jgi:TRAP-type C4-dicarboxylate transport system permease small subunit